MNNNSQGEGKVLRQVFEEKLWERSLRKEREKKGAFEQDGLIFAKMFGIIVFLCLLHIPLLKTVPLDHQMSFMSLSHYIAK